MQSILAVDDSASMRKMVAFTLTGAGFHVVEAVDEIDFHKGRAPESAMRKLRRLYLRANLDTADVRLLRGVLADTQRMARLAQAASTAGKIG